MTQVHQRGKTSHLLAMTLTPALYVALAWLWSGRGEVIDDEGLLAKLGAQLVAAHPLDGLFALKLHPLASAALAPVADLSWQTWRWLHVAFGGLAVALLTDAARSLSRRAWLAGLVMACSPALVVSGAAGQGNAVGVLVQCAALWLAARGRRGGFALAVGALPFFRAELALVSALGALFALWSWPERRRSTFALTLTIPTLYWLGGALYHGDLLFPAHYPPSPTQGVPHNDIYGFPPTLTASLLLTLQYIGYVCAVWPLAFGRRLGARAPLGRLAVACGGLSVVALTLVPLTGGFADVPWPRYLLLALPGLALSVAEVSRNRYVAGLVAGVVTLAAGWVLTSANQPIPFAGALERPDVGELAEKIHAQNAKTTVYTPNMALAFALERRAHPTRFVPSHDVHYELWGLLNRGNGQYHRLVQAVGEKYYGGVTWPCEFRRLDTGETAIWVNEQDVRHQLFKTPPVGSKAPCERVGRFEVCRGLQRPVSQPWSEVLDEAIMSGPCANLHGH